MNCKINKSTIRIFGLCAFYLLYLYNSASANTDAAGAVNWEVGDGVSVDTCKYCLSLLALLVQEHKY